MIGFDRFFEKGRLLGEGLEEAVGVGGEGVGGVEFGGME